MKIWIGQYSDMSGGCRYNRQVFTNEEVAKRWREQAEIINVNDNDDIGSYSLQEVDCDTWDGEDVVPYYQAEVCIKDGVSQVWYYKLFKWKVDEKVDYEFDNSISDWIFEHYKEQKYAHTTFYAMSKEEIIRLITDFHIRLGVDVGQVVYSKNWDA